MKCKICNTSYPSKYYFQYYDDKFPCSSCIKAGHINRDVVLEGMKDLRNINNLDIWLDQLSKENIIKDPALFEFVKTILLRLRDDSRKILAKDEDVIVSITNAQLEIKSPQEKVFLLLFFSIFTTVLVFWILLMPFYITLKSILFSLYFLALFRTFKFFLRTGRTLKVDNSLYRIESAATNSLLKKFRFLISLSKDFQHISLNYSDIQNFLVSRESHRLFDDYYFLTCEPKLGHKFTIGHTRNRNTAEGIKEHLNKIIVTSTQTQTSQRVGKRSGAQN